MADTHNKLKSNGISLGSIAGTIAQNLGSNVTGIISALPTAKYTSGARVKLSINNRLVGFAFGVSWNISTTVSEIRTIDDYFPWELTPQHISVTGTLSMLHIPGEGPSISLHQSHALNFLQQKYITIEVRDSATDHLLFFTNKAIVVSRAEDLRAEQLGSITLQWRAIGWKDELEPEKPLDWVDANEKNIQKALRDGIQKEKDNKAIFDSKIKEALEAVKKSAPKVLPGNGLSIPSGGVLA